MKTPSKNMELLGIAADSLDSVICLIQLSMPAQFHLDVLKAMLPKLLDDLRTVYVEETSDDPWSIDSILEEKGEPS